MWKIYFLINVAISKLKGCNLVMHRAPQIESDLCDGEGAN